MKSNRYGLCMDASPAAESSHARRMHRAMAPARPGGKSVSRAALPAAPFDFFSLRLLAVSLTSQRRSNMLTTI